MKTNKTCRLCSASYVPERGGTETCLKCRTTTCANCKCKFARTRLSTRFCSRQCKHEAMKGIEPTHLAKNRGKKPRTYYVRNRDKHGGAEVREWRTAVYQRDNYTCQECGQHGGALNADHIKPWSSHPELRFDLDNGRTLCVECHKKTPTYGWKAYWAKVRASQPKLPGMEPERLSQLSLLEAV